MTKELAIKIIAGDVLGTPEQTHEAVKMAVKALSSEPVRHGHWEWKDNGGFGNYHCTVCGYLPYGKFTQEYRPDYMYCPNCGARMDEVEDEDS